MNYFVEALASSHEAESNVRHLGEFATLESAINASIKLIDSFLLGNYEPGMSAADLYFIYQNAAEIPVIFSADEETINLSAFNHFMFAKSRCTEICAHKTNPQITHS